MIDRVGLKFVKLCTKYGLARSNIMDELHARDNNTGNYDLIEFLNVYGSRVLRVQ